MPDSVGILTLDLSLTATGVCQCGCGRPAPLATVTRSGRGEVKGQPRRFIRGHALRSAPEEYIINHETGCWEWQLAKDRKGYGRRYFSGRQGCPAHRAAYQMANGSIPEGLCVMHKCDNPGCVNPDHLTLGDYAANNHDRDRKGRQVSLRGSVHHAARITEAIAAAIRNRVAAGERQKDVAVSLGISNGIVWAVVHQRTWRHV